MGPIKSVQVVTIQSSDGYIAVAPASRVICSSAGTGSLGISVKSPYLAGPLNTSASAAGAVSGVFNRPQEVLNPGATQIDDIDSGATYATTQTDTSYTADAVSLTGNGSGAEITVTGTVVGGFFIPTSVAMVEWGKDYARGDRLQITCEDATATDPFDITFTLGDAMMTNLAYETTQTDTGASAYTGVSAVTTHGGGSGAAATIQGTHYAATTDSPTPYFVLSGIDITTAGSAYLVGDSMTFTCGAADAFTISWAVPSTSYLSNSGAATLIVAAGDTVPFPVTELRNNNTNDWVFVLVG
jgi:hypothetical protein